MACSYFRIGGADKQLNVMEEDFTLPDDMFTDNPVFVDTSQEFDDDCGDACKICLLYTSPSPRDRQKSRMPSSA